MNEPRINSRACQSRRAAAAIALMSSVAMLTPGNATAETLLRAGTLACAGEGGWGLIITSKKTFRCTFSSTDRSVRGEYIGEIRKYGLDVGKTGDTVLMWWVFGPTDKVGDSYVAGSLQGKYAGVGAEASAGIGLGANALVGAGDGSFALQPISVQVQTGLSVAAGVQTLSLRYVGPME